MKRLPLLLAWLIGGIVFAVVAWASLAFASELWASGVFSFCLFVLLIATAGAICTSGARRAFWVGFSVLGWGYWLLILGLFPDSVGPQLISTRGLQWLHNKLHADAVVVIPGSPFLTRAGSGVAYADFDQDGSLDIVTSNGLGTQLYVNQGTGRFANVTVGAISNSTWQNFSRIGHSLCAILAALVGAVLARFLYGRRLQKRQPTPRCTGTSSRRGLN